jgi:methylmalonyl-CoA/ethylmalonyl-CoA epimerase
VLEITRIDHISMAVPETGPQVDLLERLFGFEVTGTWTEDEAGYEGVNLAVPGSSDVGWEVLAPTRRDSFVQRFLDSPLGPGLHHATFEVPDLRAAADELRALHIEPWGAPPFDAPDDAWHEVFVHPRDGSGYLFQLVTADESAGWHDQKWGRPADERSDTLGIVAVNHLSHAHPDRTQLASWYELVFGFRGIYAASGTDGPFATAVLETPSDQMRWEVLQPLGADSFVQKFLDTRGPAMHHVTFEVGDWRRAVEACLNRGVPIFGERDGVTEGARWREAFIHPRHTGGMLVQFFWEERPGIWI